MQHSAKRLGSADAPSKAPSAVAGTDLFVHYLKRLSSLTAILSAELQHGEVNRDIHQGQRQLQKVKDSGDRTRELQLSRALSYAAIAKEVQTGRLYQVTKEQLRASLMTLQAVVKSWPPPLVLDIWNHHVHRISSTTVQAMSEPE